MTYRLTVLEHPTWAQRVTSGNRIGRRGNRIEEGEGEGGYESGPGEGKEFERWKSERRKTKGEDFSHLFREAGQAYCGVRST
jgi:hypothetical protein